MSREIKMVEAAIIEAENTGVYFTPITWRYIQYSGRYMPVPRYNSVGMRVY